MTEKLNHSSKTKPSAASALRRFRDSEAGTLTAFSLYIFIAMIMICGLTIDLMRYEAVRTRLQSTTDRAVLAAADLDNTLDAKAVVEDYFAKAGMADYLDDVVVDKGLNYKEVTAEVSATIPTWFMNMSGIYDLDAVAASKAEERIQNIEISLVLDISGSMRGTKNANMIDAANDFAETIMEANENLASDGTGLAAISVIPYNASVSAPNYLLNEYNVKTHQTFSRCARFASSDFNRLSLSTTAQIDRLSHFDRNNSYLNRSGGVNFIARPWCPTSGVEDILPLSTSLSDLQSKISSLGAEGNTATDLGMKWAAALLDPGSRTMVNNLVGDNRLDSRLAGRPEAYNDPETIKVIVLMTDGANTSQYDLKSQFKGTMSPVWYSADTDKYYVYFENRDNAGQKAWWDPGRKPQADENGNDEELGRWRKRIPKNPRKDAVQLSHAELFSRYSVRYVSEYFFRVQSDSQSDIRNQYRYAWHTYAGNTSADNYTKSLCTLLKAQKVQIFTIGFEAPQRGQDLMRACATSPSHYYDVNGVEISEAFSSIANTIQQLRLAL
ncbi:MAG: pilus assembly protein TadG-related protein [Dinoroseobacter sp.]|nr:pilus assembly protein TadG-related protein [Dinoroseobacter sp.]MDJ0993767.1 pilus assembly protein TadG-related protein [Dinoroseobacter sp.]